MLASVSPASYLAMISGQSDCGIFPLLFDFSISNDLGPFCAVAFQQLARHDGKRFRRRDRPNVLSYRKRLGTAIAPFLPRRSGDGRETAPLSSRENSGKQDNSEAFYSVPKQIDRSYFCLPARLPPDDFSWIENIIRIKRLLDAAHDRYCFAVFTNQEIHLPITDAVLAGTRALHC